MSVEGVGIVTIGGLAVATVGIGALIAVGAPIGAGVLMVRGVMWCGDRLKDNYEDACQQWTSLMDAAWADHLTQVTDLPDAMAEAARRAAVPAANLHLGERDQVSSRTGADGDLAALLAAARAERFAEGVERTSERVDDEARRRARFAVEAAERQLEALRRQPAAAERWLDQRREVVHLQGLLRSLETMTREMAALALADEVSVAAVTSRIERAGSEADALLAGDWTASRAGLSRVVSVVQELERDVFRLARRGQRDRIAVAIAATVHGLGYRAPDGEEPEISVNGDFASVSALRRVGGDEHAVTFDVSLDGEVTYDLSGYVGGACAADAKELFDALRERGIVILDGPALERLEGRPAADLTMESLAEHHHVPQVGQPRDQARIAARLLEVMQRMGFEHVRQSATAGTVDIEGFTGRVGYRVVVPPHGQAEIVRDGEVVSTDPHDLLAAEAGAGLDAGAGQVIRQRERVREALGRSQRRRAARSVGS